MSLELAWSATGTVDLDLYIYKQGFVFGNATSVAAKDDTTTETTSAGTAKISQQLVAGTYMINVMAYTGFYPDNTTVSRTANYQLKLNGQVICPTN